MPQSLFVIWSDEAKADLRSIYNSLLFKNSKETTQKIREEIISAPEAIVFPEQYQFDEIHYRYRRIIVRNYKILYRVEDKTIRITSIVDSRYDY
ncbi:type II toxin-antitoxin system RelE/ParE family toxin [Flavobacterium sp. RHBU_3]|uniref:type II toxin-antitoxin system RelE/ParE family toxin n=1 Tax=Flavobacterium sp. RHBU_3 TaxID=3391184 RepID=UPI003985266A